MKTIRESEIQVMLADYLVVRYPKVIFHSDFGSGVKLSFTRQISRSDKMAKGERSQICSSQNLAMDMLVFLLN